MMLMLQPMAIDRIYSLGIPATLVVAGALSAEKSLPAWKLADMLGSASYAIYLFHLLALGMVVKIWPYVDWGNGAFAIVGFGVILLSGCGIYLALEKPILAFFSSLRVKRKTTGAAAKCAPSTQHSQP
jgi:exopolysaccharide production protein ExoZ